MRPTGRLHIGHYFGALQNWVALQNDPQYECFFFIADWHALTTDYADTSTLAQNSIEIGTDWLASGLDPAKSTLFVQSEVTEHAELHLLLSMITSLGWLERVPTYKELLENIKDKDLHTYGFLGYPVLQAADIVMYGAPTADLLVPVGEDQESHVELGREIVRRFNLLYGFSVKDELFAPENRKTLRALLDRVGWPPGFGPADALAAQKVVPWLHKLASEAGLGNFVSSAGELGRYFVTADPLREPAAMLTATPRVSGTDGRKMSKSYNNFISLSETDDAIRTKVRAMMTDPARKRRQDPGNPDVCPVFDWHKLFPEAQTPEKRARIDRVSLECRTAAIGCVECKGLMADALIEWIEPVRERREGYAAQPGKVLEILDAGSEKARGVARNTMSRVREAVFGWQKLRTDLAGAPPAPTDVKVGN
jgi:tryptophanyl-tRNA synthetase